MDSVTHDEESSLLELARRSRRARARMLRARAESHSSVSRTDDEIVEVIDITDRTPRIRLFARSVGFPQSDRPFSPPD